MVTGHDLHSPASIDLWLLLPQFFGNTQRDLAGCVFKCGIVGRCSGAGRIGRHGGSAFDNWIRVTGTHHREIYAHLLPRIDIAGQSGHCFNALGADEDTSSLRELYYLGHEHVGAVLRGALFHSVILQWRFEGHWLNDDRTLSVGLQSLQIPNDLITSPWASYQKPGLIQRHCYADANASGSQTGGTGLLRLESTSASDKNGKGNDNATHEVPRLSRPSELYASWKLVLVGWYEPPPDGWRNIPITLTDRGSEC